MMDKKPHIKPYLYGMLAGFGAISLSILFFFLIYRFDGFGNAISALTGILMPFIYGAVIAYLLKPVCNCVEDFLRRLLPEKMGTAANMLAVTVSLLFGILVVYALIMMIVPQLITSVTTMIGVLIMMLSISPKMTLIALLILPVSLVLVLIVVRFSQKYFKSQQAILGVVNGQVEEVYSGHNVVKAFNREAVVLADFNAANDKLYESAWKSQFLSGLMQPIMMFVGNLGYVAVALSGSLLAIRGTITIGEIQAFIQYVRNFTQPMQQIAQVINQVQSMAAASERVFEFLEEKEEVQTAEHPVQLEQVRGSVDFEHVSFGYKPEQCIIHDFSAQVQPGQKIAIVGPTGAGKTTMVKLLMRFYDVNSGTILLDGHDIRDFDRRQLRESFGMVLQDTWLFQGTIMENIRYGRLDATDEEVIAAAKAAHADSFIRQLPGGYQMELNEDASNVSQGQKQLLTIARAILADNKILILDEATSSVDTRTEQRIQTAMDNLMRGRTSFVIAHRLSTVRNMDRILVVRDGGIAEEGKHDELLEKGGVYAAMWEEYQKAAQWKVGGVA